MGLFGFRLARKSAGLSIDEVVRRLEAAQATLSGIAVTPETCMQSPTVSGLVKAIAGRISTMPPHVFKKILKDGRTSKEALPNHPVERLLAMPNGWQTSTNYWLDAMSWRLRYGNFYGFKARGATGPIRRIEPLHPGSVDVVQNDDLSLTYKVSTPTGAQKEYGQDEIHHARGMARNGFKGDSPLMDVREAIALEIAAEKYGASFFGNGAMPSLVFQYVAGSAGHKTDEERAKFIEDFTARYSGRGRFSAMLMPKGIELGEPISVENEKAQFLETRKLQRNIIAGALGVPPHLVGDLERATFTNIEHQSLELVSSVILPHVREFETAMERDLLTPADRASGVIIRFNIDGALRADFKSRQEGLNIQRMAGVINADEWREMEGWNPIPDGSGQTYWTQGPSGQNSGTEADGIKDPEPQP